MMEKVPDSPGLSVPVEVTRRVTDRPLSEAWIPDGLIAETRRVWSPIYGREISDDEAIEILTNVKRLAEVLLRAEGEGCTS
jgi:hypothetical protein